MLAPVLLVAGWHIQVHRLLVHRHGRMVNDDRLRINHLGLRKVANVNAAIHPRLVHPDGHAYIGLGKSRSQGASGQGKCYDFFHDSSPID